MGGGNLLLVIHHIIWKYVTASKLCLRPIFPNPLIVWYLEVAYAVGDDSSDRWHDDRHDRGDGGHDGGLLHADAELPHVDGEVGVQHVQSYTIHTNNYFHRDSN